MLVSRGYVYTISVSNFLINIIICEKNFSNILRNIKYLEIIQIIFTIACNKITQSIQAILNNFYNINN